MMNKLVEAIKGMAINMIIGQLEANKKELATKIAAQVDIPFVKESDEIKLAEGVLSAVKDVIEGMAKK